MRLYKRIFSMMPMLYILVHLLLFLLLLAPLRFLSSQRQEKIYAGSALAFFILLEALFFFFPEALANAFQWPDLLFFSEYSLLIASLLCFWGLRFSAERGAKIRVALLSFLLISLSIYHSQWMFFQPFLQVGHFDKNRICLQGSPHSCAPAAAATALTYLGIPTTEEEMIFLCRTSFQGTRTLGLYRGLFIKTEGTRYFPRFSSMTLSQLKQTSSPVLLSVGFSAHMDLATRKELEKSWNPRERHLVVFLGFHPSGGVKIGDPRYGLEIWPQRHFQALWQGWCLTF